MPYDDYLPSLDIEHIRDACIEKALAEPEQAGVHHSFKAGRVQLADWRSWVFCQAADRSPAILSYKASPLIVDVRLGSVSIPFPVDFRLETRSGFHFVAFDMPSIELLQHGILLSVAARHSPHRLVGLTDQELDIYIESGRMPGPLDSKTLGLASGSNRHSPPSRL